MDFYRTRAGPSASSHLYLFHTASHTEMQYKPYLEPEVIFQTESFTVLSISVSGRLNLACKPFFVNSTKIPLNTDPLFMISNAFKLHKGLLKTEYWFQNQQAHAMLRRYSVHIETHIPWNRKTMFQKRHLDTIYQN